MEAEIPVISLLNINAKRHRECHYILTSPRSLQACANLRIKPIDVLAQSLDDFRHSSASQGLCDSLLVTAHNELEKQKQVKLQKARNERDRIISEEHKFAKRRVERTRDDQPNVVHTSLADTVLPKKDWRILSALMKKGEAIQQQAMKTRNERDHQKIACGGTRKADILHIPFKDLQRERKLKKKEQEMKLKEIQSKRAEVSELLEKGICYQQNRAAKNKGIILSRKSEEHRAKSSAERERFMTSRLETDHQERIAEEMLARSLTAKEHGVTQRLQQQKERHQHKQQLVLEKRNKMTAMRKKRLNELEESLNNWKEQTDQYCEESMARAGEKHSQVLCERVDRLQQKHKERTKKHKEALLRLREEDTMKRAALAQGIEARMRKTEELARKQRDAATMMRQTAQLSARLRETVKNHYTRNAFSEMARDAEMYASLETHSHHMS